ncbi:hypothetical protein KP509_10G059900 [Ceratopteris richardii]|uniref:Uncharacterized protein n=1 Tax=Ceratopteris richardii TaxID=49495 RepID=A0A8T2U1K0_CERRI|nr:hypothetical protein KP509_10G059900 [Ceratopteris richardii]
MGTFLRGRKVFHDHHHGRSLSDINTFFNNQHDKFLQIVSV